MDHKGRKICQCDSLFVATSWILFKDVGAYTQQVACTNVIADILYLLRRKVRTDKTRLDENREVILDEERIKVRLSMVGGNRDF